MKRLLILSLIGCLALVIPVSLRAAGTTSNPNDQTQLRVRNDNGVMYVSTEANTPVATPELTTAQQTTAQPSTRSSWTIGRSPLNNIEIQLPQGFAPTIGGFINGVLSLVMVIAAMLVFFYLIWGAFDWITSGGDKGKTERARQKLTSAVIGLIIIASSYAILMLSLRFLGFASLSDVFQSAGTIRGGAEPAAETELGEIIQATPSAAPSN